MSMNNSYPWNRVGLGCRPLPETFDVDFINHIGNVYLNQSIWNKKDQDWNRISQQVHADFDHKMGHDEVERHIAELKR